MKITVSTETLAGNMGDGWSDNNEANRAYSNFLKTEIVESIKDEYPNAEINVSVDAVDDTSGCTSSPSVFVESDDRDMADILSANIDAIIRIETLIDNEINYAWETWCDSDEARRFWDSEK